MTTKITLTILLTLPILWSCQTEAPQKEEKIAWLRQNAIPVQTIDPRDTDYSDLQLLKEELQNVRIIGLGEQSHGDGSSFLAKARLLKFLNEELNFSVLAFESGMIDCALAVKAYESGIPIDSAYRLGLFKIWSNSKQFKPVRELNGRDSSSFFEPFVGFDFQYSGTLSAKSRRDSIYQFIRKHVPGLDSTAFSTVWQVLGLSGAREYRKAKQDTALQKWFFSELDSLSKLVEQIKPISRSDQFMARGILNLNSYYYFLFNMNINRPDKKIFNIRDSIMAENVIWLEPTSWG